jgi:2,3-bisphosphoglycerate-independent phosphoglycerate mutase
MKYAIVLGDGMADHPVETLGGKTPLAAARTPHMDRVAADGRVGLVHTIPQGMPPGSDVANLAIMGYDPARWYTGRAPLEAASLDVALAPGDLAFRCNFVTVAEGTMADYSAGHITTREAKVLVDTLNEKLGSAALRFHAGTSYRNLMVMSDVADMALQTTPPHDILDQPIEGHWPKGEGADEIKALMARSQDILAEHDVNRVRTDMGENPANMIWLWGEGRRPALTSFAERFGVTAAVICAVDLVRGIAKSIGWTVVPVEGATGYLDTDYAAKGRAAVEALETHDLVFVHVEAPDEAGHSGDARAKVEAIERIDADIVAPLLDSLAGRGVYRMMVLCDHPTPVALRTHVAEPVPVALCGTGITPMRELAYTESDAAHGEVDIDRGHDLMEYFLQSGLRP